MRLIGNLNVTGCTFSFNYLTMLSTMPICCIYKHSCHAQKLSAKDLLGFLLELVHLLLEQAGPKRVLLELVKLPEMLPRVQECVS